MSLFNGIKMTVQPCGLQCNQCSAWYPVRWFVKCHICENVHVCRNCNVNEQHLSQCEVCCQFACNDCHKDQDACVFCHRNVCVNCVHFEFQSAAIEIAQISAVCMDCHNTCEEYFGSDSALFTSASSQTAESEEVGS